MAYTIVAGTICIVVMVALFTFFGERYGAAIPVHNFAPDNGYVLIDQRTDDGAIIKPMSARPYYGERCMKRVRGQTVNGFCWQ